MTDFIAPTTKESFHILYSFFLKNQHCKGSPWLMDKTFYPHPLENCCVFIIRLKCNENNSKMTNLYF